ncbi:MAG: hypothetical protein M3Y33_01155 [Actinomycetota bacterium]|nr:hypothetical protein [Actinomycetota bacterium]
MIEASDAPMVSAHLADHECPEDVTRRMRIAVIMGTNPGDAKSTESRRIY